MNRAELIKLIRDNKSCSVAEANKILDSITCPEPTLFDRYAMAALSGILAKFAGLGQSEQVIDIVLSEAFLYARKAMSLRVTSLEG